MSAGRIALASVGETTEQDDGGDTAYRRLRADVVLGRLAPGRKLGLEGLLSLIHI